MDWPIRRVPVLYISVWWIDAATGAPDSARWMSLRISPADWYRSPASFSMALSTMASHQAGSSGSIRDGGTGASRTCW